MHSLVGDAILFYAVAGFQCFPWQTFPVAAGVRHGGGQSDRMCAHGRGGEGEGADLTTRARVHT